MQIFRSKTHVLHTKKEKGTAASSDKVNKVGNLFAVKIKTIK